MELEGGDGDGAGARGALKPEAPTILHRPIPHWPSECCHPPPHHHPPGTTELRVLLLRSRSVGTARKPLAWLHTPRLGHGHAFFWGGGGHQLLCLYLLGALQSSHTPCAVVSRPTAPFDDAPLMKLLASVGLQPTTLEGDDTVRLAYGGGGGGDMAGVRPALETQLSSKALKAKDLYQGGCMAPRQRLELRTLACRCRGFRYCPRRGCR
jgi:hypothetical protein